jgi:benzodiazapine receptor
MVHFIKTRWPSLILFLALIAIVQLIGAAVTFPNIPTWYAGLQKAPWSPPNWLFGPVWTVLYFIIAIVGWRFWLGFWGSPKEKLRKPVFKFYFLQLFFNAIWSPLFFGAHLVELAFIDLLLTIIFTFKTLREAEKVNPTAGYWLIPYLLWLCFALSLNGMIWVLN